MKTKLILLCLAVCACGPGGDPAPDLTGEGISALDPRPAFLGTWLVVDSTTVSGSTSVQDTTLTISNVGAVDQLAIVNNEHGCAIPARAVTPSTLTTSAVTCPLWLDTAQCSVVITYSAGTGSLTGPMLSISLPASIFRQCPGAPSTTPYTASFVGHQ